MSSAGLFSEEDGRLFAAGQHLRLGEVLGSHLTGDGAWFAVWAPRAAEVSVIGDFNAWQPHPLTRSADVWQGFVAGARSGQLYKYRIETDQGAAFDKADPFAMHHETPPGTASRLWRVDYRWGDDEWLRARAARHSDESPISIYEAHLGSWRREGGEVLGYARLAPLLADHAERCGFTHIELLPVTEHPFYGSWGYQSTGLFAPTARYGPPEGLMYLVDHLHQRGIGVIFDWVPSHFPKDAHGLYAFDGAPLFEHSDPRRGHHPRWGSAVYDYGRPEVQSFLLSSAMHWVERFHADGLRVDAVASMLYLDDGREEGQWVPNRHGGNENLEAIALLRRLTDTVREHDAAVLTIAEESTAWPGVTKAVEDGGLGFSRKWDMGWMHDTLAYLAVPPAERAAHHGKLTFRPIYAHGERFVLPLSHDEVSGEAGSLWQQMPGDPAQRRAQLRLLYAYMYALPGDKLLFMGAERGEERGWDHDEALVWDTKEEGISRCVTDLNRLYRELPSLHRADHWAETSADVPAGGFAWVDCDDAESRSLVFLRRADAGAAPVLVVCNFAATSRQDVRVGVPAPGHWRERLNTDGEIYGGGGLGNLGGVDSESIPAHGFAQSIRLTLPPLSVLYLTP